MVPVGERRGRRGRRQGWRRRERRRRGCARARADRIEGYVEARGRDPGIARTHGVGGLDDLKIAYVWSRLPSVG